MNPEQFGLTSETTQALSGSIFAAGLREYLRPAKSITKRICGAALCIGVAELLLKAVERADLLAFIKKG